MIRKIIWLTYSLLVAYSLSSCTGSDPATPQPLPTFVAPGIKDNPLLEEDGNSTSQVTSQLGAIVNYNFDVSLDYAGHRAEVTQYVEVVNPGPDVWNELVFYLPPGLQTDRFVLSTVEMRDGVESSAMQKQVTSDGFLNFQLPKFLNPKESRMITIKYGLEATQVDLASLSPVGLSLIHI